MTLVDQISAAFTRVANVVHFSRMEMTQAAMPAPNSGTISVLGCVYGGTGTATAAAPSTTSLYTAIRRADLLVTTAATTAVAGFRTTGASLFRGTAGIGGFEAKLIGGPATGVATATGRFFLGFRNATGAPTDVNPSTLVNMIGIGWDSADTEVQLMSNDASGTATKVALTGWARPTTDRSVLYSLELWCNGGDAGLSYRVTNVISGVVVSGTVSSDIPAANLALLPLIYSSVGGTSSVTGITFVHYIAKEIL